MIHAAHIANANAYRDDPQWTNDWNSVLHANGFPNTTFTVDYVASGTSFSAPVVAGIAARLRQTFPNMKARDIWNYIHDSATSLPSNFDGDGKADNDRLAYISPSD
jgi:subtilase family serine protease